MLENESNPQSAEWLASSSDQLAPPALSQSDARADALPAADQRASPDGAAGNAPTAAPRNNHGTGRLGSCTSCEARR